MAEDQRRIAERVPLDIPIEGKIGEIAVRIVEISLVGCLLEHSDRMAMGSTFTVRFRWSGENVSLKGRVTRTVMQQVDGGMGYQSGIQFAESIEESPEPLQRLVRSLLPDFMPEIEAAAPSLFADHPFFRHVDDDDETEAVPAGRTASETEPETAGKTDEKLRPAPPLEIPHPLEIELQPEDEIEEEIEIDWPTPFIECTLHNGVWTRRAVSEPLQPREGFTIVKPEHDHEIAELCHTYRVADPDTRRLIRVSFDLVNAQHGVHAES